MTNGLSQVPGPDGRFGNEPPLDEDDIALAKELHPLYEKTLGGAMHFFDEKDVIEVSRLPDRDGRIKVRRLTEKGQIETLTDVRQEERQAGRFTQVIAHSRRADFTVAVPKMRVTEPVFGYRLTAMRSPLTSGVFWTIRRRIVLDITLEKYVEKQQLSPSLYQKIISAIKGNARFLVVGPQSVGKTVALTAILRATHAIYPDTFFGIVEDAWEIELPDPIMVVYIQTNDEWDLGRLIPTLVSTGVRSLNPGELSSGADQVVEAFGTGIRRTSGVTIHGDFKEAGYLRVEQLHFKENKPVVRTAIQQAFTHTLLMDHLGPGGLPRIAGLYVPSHLDEQGYTLIDA